MLGKKGIGIETVVVMIIALVLLSVILPAIIKNLSGGYGFFGTLICGLSQDFDADGRSDTLERWGVGDGCPCDSKIGGVSGAAQAAVGGIYNIATGKKCRIDPPSCLNLLAVTCATGKPPRADLCSSSTAIEDKNCLDLKNYGKPCGTNKEGACNACGQCISLCEFLNANKDNELAKEVFKEIQGQYGVDTYSVPDDYFCGCSSETVAKKGDPKNPAIRIINQDETQAYGPDKLSLCPNAFRQGPLYGSFDIGSAAKNGYCCSTRDLLNQKRQEKDLELKKAETDCTRKVREYWASHQQNQVIQDKNALSCVRTSIMDCYNQGIINKQLCDQTTLLLQNLIQSAGSMLIISPNAQTTYLSFPGFVFPSPDGSSSDSALTLSFPTCIAQEDTLNPLDLEWVDHDYNKQLQFLLRNQDGLDRVFIDFPWTTGDREFRGITLRNGLHPSSTKPLTGLCFLYAQYWGPGH